MRTREEIEDNDNTIESTASSNSVVDTCRAALQLEVLLDIRDLLEKHLSHKEEPL